MNRIEAKQHVQRLIRAGKIRREAADSALASLLENPAILAKLEAPPKPAPRPVPVRAAVPPTPPPIPNVGALDPPTGPEASLPTDLYPLSVALEVAQRRASIEAPPTGGARITRGG